jgi:hypothetical protein
VSLVALDTLKGLVYVELGSGINERVGLRQWKKSICQVDVLAAAAATTTASNSPGQRRVTGTNRLLLLLLVFSTFCRRLVDPA